MDAPVELDTYTIHKILGSKSIGINKALTSIVLQEYIRFQKQWVQRHTKSMFECLLYNYANGENYNITVSCKTPDEKKTMYVTCNLESSQKNREYFEITFGMNSKNDPMLCSEQHKNYIKIPHFFDESIENTDIDANTNVKVKTCICNAIFNAFMSIAQKIDVRYMRENYTCRGHTLFYKKQKDMHTIAHIFHKNGFHIDVKHERYLHSSGTFEFAYKDLSTVK